MSSLPPLPPGATLDLPPLPEGATLDEPEKEKPGIVSAVFQSLFTAGRPLLGAPETAAQIVSGTVSGPVSGIAGITASALPGGKTGPEAVADTAEALTFQPRS